MKIFVLILLVFVRTSSAETASPFQSLWSTFNSFAGPFQTFSDQIIHQTTSFSGKIFNSAVRSFFSENEVKRDQETDETDDNPVAMAVTFINESPFRVSVSWDNDEEWHRVIDVIPPKQSAKINTYSTHQFVFTREGTRDMLAEEITIMPNKFEYVLSKDAKPINPTDHNGKQCEDRYRKKCLEYAKHNECEHNPGWMIVNCPKSCNSCELLDPDKRCDPKFLNVSAENVWKPGDLTKMFERIIDLWKDEVQIIGKPPGMPYVLQFDKFLSEHEVDTLVEWGNKLGYQRSTDTGQPNERGEVTKIFSSSRTSSNAWCTQECEKDPVVQVISQRIVNMTQVPYTNYEQFQLLQYELGQYYKVHHDMSPKEDNRAGGVRILTFFLYLSDVEEGGETEFPKLGIKVAPKKGRAILWPSVLDEDPRAQDPRTVHAALPVKKGLKLAANHWIHSHDFKIANKWGCTGAFD